MSQVRFLIILLTSLLLSSCMVSQHDLQMQRDLMEMKRRLADAERTVKELQDDTSGGVRAHVETLARNQADFQAELDGVRVDLQSMQGRTGDQERFNDNLRQDLSLLRDELSLQLADHAQRLAVLEAGGLRNEPLTNTRSPSAVAMPANNPAAGMTATTPATPQGESAPALYERALKKIREEQDFVAGRELMETFLKRYPGDDLAVNAAYWVGETYYAEKAYEKAILRFEDLIQKYGEHPKVASAMLKQALAFEASGDKATGRLLLQRVIERFPLSEEAKKARQMLQGN
ncbi:MAG: tol-pal system protein YbgF [Desulfuromonadales bacterium]|nr:tol-pal system protein YbgF [Desulfuromonadales bacterium]